MYNLGKGLWYDQDAFSMNVKLGSGMEFDENNCIINGNYLGKEVVTGNSSPESFNLNNFIKEGVQKFSLQSRTHNSSVDNIPITNGGGGHTVSGELTVIDASLNETETMIGQKLILSNRTGGDTKEYIRSYREGVWSPWLTTVTMQEVGQTSSFDKYIDNGMYSGVYVGATTDTLTQYETFVLVTINNHAVNSLSNGQIPHMVSQFKYALKPDASNPVSFASRVLMKQNDTWISVSDWVSLK
jgi:hypothetical protein